MNRPSDLDYRADGPDIPQWITVPQHIPPCAARGQRPLRVGWVHAAESHDGTGGDEESRRPDAAAPEAWERFGSFRFLPLKGLRAAFRRLRKKKCLPTQSLWAEHIHVR